jgi:hypothetical protein
MRRAALVFLMATALAAGSAPAGARSPVLVELFTSQGCSSCVNAGELVAQLDQKPRVLTLTFPVDYWDYLGWRDTLAKPEFSERQRLYMQALALRDVYTPQVVVDGHLQAAAVDRATIDKLVKDAGRAPGAAPVVGVGKTWIGVGRGVAPAGGAVVWLVRYLPGDQAVRVLAGDNRGKTVVEHNVVRELTRLGGWSGTAKRFRLAASNDQDLKTVVIVQAVRSGRVLAVAKA